jgi:hypothetical protein
VAAESTGWAVSFSLAIPSGCKNLRRRQVAEQRTVTGPSPEYIKTQAILVQRVARTRRGIQNSKRNTRSSNGSHAQRLPRAPLLIRGTHVIRFRILFLFLFLSLTTGTGKGDTPKGILLREGNGPRAPLLIRGSKAGPSEGFNSCLRVLGLRAHYWSEVRRPAPRKGSTAASGHSGSAPTTDQGFVGWPSKGSQPPQTQSER